MHRRTAPALALATTLALVGCEKSERPTAPELEPALAVTPAHALSFRQLSAGNDLTCGVTTSNIAYCWGSNHQGQLGSGTSTGAFEPHPRPVRVVGGLAFAEVSAGGVHTCGVTTGGVAYCWGGNGVGELGTSTNTGRDRCFDDYPCNPRPVPVASGLAFRQVSASPGVGAAFGHSCGVTTTNVAYCWGINQSGELGIGSETGPQLCAPFDIPCSTRPVRVAGGLRFRVVSAGVRHTCGVTTDNVACCWGANDSGQLGDGTTAFVRPSPVRVAGSLAFDRVSAGGLHTCGVTTSHVVYCWGSNTDAQLGIGNNTGPEICRGDPCSTHPVRVGGGIAFGFVNAGFLHTCALTANVAYCWGSNFAGELGIGTSTGPEQCVTELGERFPCSTRPVRVVGKLLFRGVQAGGFHTCGLTTTKVAYCWGVNQFGQLGDGTTTTRVRPVAVAPPAR